ncbi:lamina-associated polypeptide 2, isoforms alpha/zeta-like isoform X1 [Xenopus laevis]|uniref:Lamina-associated polypeptide 2, isoforms alpha/zeta-like isoform X1 n=2 Tax=Xenopus laevis TaxID=8355 RepID=A0A8J1L5I1_XENLA|nr:lamina-associated polypeptide 2, isoforms alpha/zeta-like isoform X1 [Xenopus laevis]
MYFLIQIQIYVVHSYIFLFVFVQGEFTNGLGLAGIGWFSYHRDNSCHLPCFGGGPLPPSFKLINKLKKKKKKKKIFYSQVRSIMADKTEEPRTSKSSAHTRSHTQVSFLACTNCKTKFSSASTDSVCVACRPSDTSPPPLASTSDSELVKALSLSLAGIQHLARIPETLDKVLERLSQPSRLDDRPTGTKRLAPPPPDSPEEQFTPSDEEGLALSEEDSDQEHIDPDLDTPRTQKEVEGLIQAVLSTLNIEDTVTEVEPAKNIFKRHKKCSYVFPAYDQLDELIKAQWKHPDHRVQVSRRFSQTYPFPQECTELWASPPAVDPPVSRLSRNTTIPVADAAAFKDPIDKRLEGFCKSAFTASGSAFRPIFAIAWVAKAMEVWVEQAAQLIGSEEPTTDNLLSQIADATSYIGDAAMDTAKMVARASAQSVAARRFLWLKTWSADLMSKRSLVSLPFQGKLLFGAELDKIISQATGGKSTLLPQTRSKRPPFKRRPFFRPFRQTQRSKPQADKTSSSFRSRYQNKQRSSWSSSKAPTKPTPDKSNSA